MGVVNLITESPWLLVVVLAASFVVHKLFAFNRLSHIKGPVSCGFSEYLHTKAFLSLKCEQWYESMTNKYGS
jgi:hypothetical protein